MKNKKKLLITLAVLVGITAVGLLIYFYPTLDLYFTAFHNKQRVTEYKDAKGETHLGLTDNTPVVTPPPKEPNKGGKGTSYFVQESYGGHLKYTIQDVQFFNRLSDSGIDTKDCARIPSLDECRDNNPFMLATFTVENIDAVPYEDDNRFIINVDSMVYFNLLDKSTRETLKCGPYMCYFDKHPPITETATDYYHFSLEQGETMEFKVGCMIEQSVYDAKAAYLYVNGYESGDVFDLYDPAYTADTESNS